MSNRVREAMRKRRRSNYIIMMVVVAFIGLLNAPKIIKTYLIDDAHTVVPTLKKESLSENQRYLFNQDIVLEKIEWPEHWVISQEDNKTKDFIERWYHLVGTKVTKENYQKLKPSLGKPHVLNAYYQGIDTPQPLTFYQQPKFWLLRNWQGEWIAISVSEEYLMPTQYIKLTQ